MIGAIVESMATAEMTHFQWAVASEVLHEAVVLAVTLFIGFTFLRFGRFFNGSEGAKGKKVSMPSGSRPAGSNAAAASRNEFELPAASKRPRSPEAKEQELRARILTVSPQHKVLPNYPQQRRESPPQQQRSPQQRFSQPSQQPQNSVARLVDEIVSRSTTSRNPEEVLSLYGEMRSQALLQNVGDWTLEQLGRHTTLEFYSAVMKCAGLTAQPGLAAKVLDDMEAAGVRAPLELYDNTIRILAGKKHFRGAIAIYDRMLTQGIAPTTVMLSCLVSFAAELSDWGRMLSFFADLSAIETPSIRTYMTVLRAHAKRGDWIGTREAFSDMRQRGVHMDTLVLNAILSTGVTLDQIEQAEAVFQEAVESDPLIGDVVSYNTLLKGYAKRHDASSAQRTLARMRESGVSPNAISFNTTIDAAVRSSRCEEAWGLLEDMRKTGVRPDKFTCSILVKGFYENRSTNASQVHAVLEMAREVYGDPPLLGNLYRGILEASSRLRDTQLLKRVFTQMGEQNVSAALVEAPGPVGPTRRQRGLQGRAFRAGPMLRLPLVACAEKGQIEDGLDLLRAALRLGIMPPPEAADRLAQAAARQGGNVHEDFVALATKYNLHLSPCPAGPPGLEF